MPTIQLNQTEFEKYVGQKLPIDELKDRISMLGTDLEGIEDNIIDVEIFPNRPDLLSMQGFARAFSSFIGKEVGLREYKVESSSEKVVIDSSVAVVRPFTACAIVKGLQLNDERIKEIIDIQEKLHITFGRHRKKVAIGIYPLDKIKLPITFCARKPADISFQPLEGDRVMSAPEILESHAKGMEFAPLLEGCEVYPLFVDANDKVLSMPPIINSHDIGKVDETTTEVFVECSGHDFDVQHKALNMIVCALADMGADIYSMELEYSDGKKITPDLSPSTIDVDLAYLNKRLGLDLSEADLKTNLEKMGLSYKNKKALVPAYRADILHQVDILEDVAIGYGYENFDPTIPRVATTGQEDAFDVFKGKIVDLLIGLGLLDTSVYHLTSAENQCVKMGAELDIIQLENSISQDYDTLRAWVLPALMEIFASNEHHEYPQKIFSVSKIFKKNSKSETGIEENDRLAVAIAADVADYTQIRQVLDYIFDNIDVEYSVAEATHSSFIDGRVGRVSVGSTKLAYIGEIKPAVLSNWGLEVPVVGLELNLTALFKEIGKKK